MTSMEKFLEWIRLGYKHVLEENGEEAVLLEKEESEERSIEETLKFDPEIMNF